MSLTVLGIETSCDETAAAVYSSHERVRSNIIYSQIALHQQYGGVVPEIASRSHIEKINMVIDNALSTGQVSLSDVDIVAVTNKPGLPGSLLVGTCFAKALAWTMQKPIIGIDHLEGHAFSSFLEHQVPFPHLCLTASGGHTSLYLIHDFGEFEILGHTLDDAAGELFDKIAKLMNLSYPGGPIIETLAQQTGFQDFFHYPRAKTQNYYFSFSGLKTAVLYDLINKELYSLKTKKTSQDFPDEIKKQVASSVLVCVKDIFIEKINNALQQFPHIKAVTFVGGVACNRYIKRALQELALHHNVGFFSPYAQYCTDNAAMIAFVGHYKAQQGLFSNYSLDILT